MSFLEANTTLGDNEFSFDQDSNRKKIKMPIVPIYPNRSFVNLVSEARHLRFNFKRTGPNKSPFNLFKVLYMGLQMERPIILKDLSKFFDIVPNEIHINYEKRKFKYEEESNCINIIPLILFVHVKSKGQESCSDLIIIKQQHIQLYAKKLLFNKIPKGNKSFEMYTFVDSYISSLFDDMIYKWFQWTNLVTKNGGTYTLRETNMSVLKRLLYQKFWEDHFFLQDSKEYSVNQFKSCVHTNNKGNSSRFGCWVDIQNDIIIFASTIYEANGKPSRTVNAMCYSNQNVKQICYLLSLYINLASISCFASNVR
ncbi:similar to Saccharomyces cerevisiae YOL104C NDJ1 Meiosis-specific telomere protein [Maudiozyma saulgeensis]|uniref:Similar to Saccharomyces cerevisiae YOL104C NDJ1 Meiosis-specific telomere protein n=1 Tax=Maudiozyma saulgeensis TaxID=1789683 RepID=A0A1X7R8F7_9SACH|nr:similar to Saccharomyces cerevisiae YOL104C NDJ1 Meiosis-specific telomere protein [Kazachstania saulgeensis]